MATSYFLLSKSSEKSVTNNEENVVYSTNKQITYILPKNLINCYVERGLFEASLIDWCKQFCKKDKFFLLQ